MSLALHLLFSLFCLVCLVFSYRVFSRCAFVHVILDENKFVNFLIFLEFNLNRTFVRQISRLPLCSNLIISQHIAATTKGSILADTSKKSFRYAIRKPGLSKSCPPGYEGSACHEGD